ncbi:MAG: hypothetical protein F4Y14_16320 [Acidobacteria bacterium]|nr:hypothetical protein [Acidobacteriota bacterium]
MSAMANRVLQGLGWTGVAVVFAALVVRFTLPDRQELWWWLAVAGLVMVAVHTLSQWRDILAFFSRRQAREGVMATSGVALALGILVAANYILSRQNVRWDLTAAQQYSLSDQTRRVLEELDAPISVLVFAREAEFPGFRDRLDEYAYVSSQVNVEYIDVDRSPVRARQYEVQAYGTIVFEYEGRIERTTSNSEQELTNALIKAVEGEERTVYFVQGHGERDPEGDDRDGYRAVRDALGRDNFRVESVVLAQTGEVPADATVMVVAGPSTDLLPAEADLLRDYLEGGGKLLLMLDPPDTEDDPPQPNLTALAGEWGIELGTDVVVDASGVGQLLGTDASVPVAATYPPHAITDGFNLLTAFPLARSVRPATGGVSGRTGVVVVETGARSWAEADLSQLATGEVTLDEDAGDVPGPVPIATVVSQTIEEPEPAPDDEDADGAADSNAGDTDADDDEPPLEARIAVFGDSDFASNSAVGIQGNRDLALNTINWLAQQENLIAIRPREPEDRRITLTADQQARVYWLSLLLLPGFIAGPAIYTSWWPREKST